MSEEAAAIISSLAWGILIVIVLGMAIGTVWKKRVVCPNMAESNVEPTLPPMSESRTTGFTWVDLLIGGCFMLLFSAHALFLFYNPSEGSEVPKGEASNEIATMAVCMVFVLIIAMRMAAIGKIEWWGLKRVSVRSLVFVPLLSYLLLVISVAVWIHTPAAEWINSVQGITEQPLVTAFRREHSPYDLWMMIIGTVIAAPVAEEVLFRGYLYPIIKHSTGLWFAMIMSGLLFSIIHASLSAFVPLFILGVFLVMVYEYTRSLWAPIILHALFNSITLINVIGTGD